MNAVNAVQLFILVWTFTAVCQADDDISVSCEDVTGTVGEEVTFTCSVSLKKPKCCITEYKFYDNDSAICKEFPQDSCEQRNSFTCSFSSTTARSGEFRFFIQASCGSKDTKFTVNITEASKPEPDTPEAQQDILATVASPGTENGFGSKNAVITAVTGCFIFIIIIIIY